MVRALAGDSTMTSRMPSPAPLAARRVTARPRPDDLVPDSFVAAATFWAAAPFLAGTLFPTPAPTPGPPRTGPVLGTLHGVPRDAHPCRNFYNPRPCPRCSPA